MADVMWSVQGWLELAAVLSLQNSADSRGRAMSSESGGNYGEGDAQEEGSVKSAAHKRRVSR